MAAIPAPATPRLIYLARHGETDWNAAGRWQGQSDVPLNDHGREQARALGESLRSAGLCVIASSDLSRARETAQIVCDHLGVPLAYVDADLRERTFGIFEGLTRDECARLHPEAWRAWTEDQTSPDGAETKAHLAARVTAAIGRAARRIDPAGAPLLLVTHGGALRAAIGTAIGAAPPPIANGAVWRLEWAGAITRAERC
ncbi:MAG: histidine phosphatase family protein [Polyangiaceae bacterium]